MNNYRIQYIDDEEKVVPAESYLVQGDFIQFYAQQDTVFSVRAKNVKSVELVKQ